MKIKYQIYILSLVILMGVFFILPGFVFASLDSQFTLQGKLTDTSDVVVSNGAFNLVFKIYTVPSGGTAVWTETWNTTARFDSTVTGTAPASAGTSVTYVNDASDAYLTVGDVLYNNTSIDEVIIEAVDATNNIITISPTSKAWAVSDALTTRISTRSGYFTARIGSITSLSSLNFTNNTYYLGITVGTDSEMTPRRRITGGSYAMDSDKLDNFHAASSSLAVAGQIPAIDYTGYFVINQRIGVGTSSPFAYLSIQDNSTLMPKFMIGSSTGTALIVDANGRVGIGTTSPSALFSVNGSAYFSGNGTSTFHNGIELRGGCFSINGTCVGGGSSIINSGLTGQFPYYAADGTTLTATSTVFLATTGLTGIGTSTPNAKLSVQGSGSNDLFNLWNTSSQQLLSVNQYGGVTQNVQSNTLNIKAVLNDGTNLDAPTDIYVSGKYAYIASYGARRFTIVDIATTTPKVISSIYDNVNFAGINSVSVAGKYAYVGCVDNTNWRFMVIDVSNSGAPVLISVLTDSTNLNYMYDINVVGQYAYISATNSNRLTIVDISNPYAPIVASSLYDAVNLNSPWGLYVVGQYAYITVSGNFSLTVVNISNPKVPKISGVLQDYTNFSSAHDIYVSGHYAYIVCATSNRLVIVDISNPNIPVVTSFLTDATNLANANDIFVSGKYAYITAVNRLVAVDVSNPGSPIIAAIKQDATNLYTPYGLYIAGKYAYVLAWDGDRLTIIDLGGLDIPTAAIGNLETNYLSVTDNANFENNLYVRNGLNVGPGGIYTDGTSSAPYMYISNKMSIGSSSPSAILSVNLSTQTLGSQLPGFLVGSTTATAFLVNSDGNVSINQSLFLPNIYSSGSAGTDLNIDANGSIYKFTSSERYKTNITDIEADTSKIFDLRPVSYSPKENPEIRTFGLIAEEVNEVLPDLVIYNKDGQSDAIKYDLLSVLMLNEFRKLNLNGNWSISEEGTLTVKNVIADEIKTKRIEMEDSATGNIYCVTIENGEWAKVIGECQ